MESGIVVRAFDICNTLLEVLLLYACAKMICKKEQTGWRDLIPYAGVFGVVYLLTWVIPTDTTKMIVEMVAWCVLMRAATRERWRSIIVTYWIFFYIIVAFSFLEVMIGQLLFHANNMILGGISVFTWQQYIISVVLKMAAVWGLYRCKAYFRYEIQRKDVVVIGLAAAFLYVVCASAGNGFFTGEKDWLDTINATVTMLFCMCFLLLLLFYKNNLYLKEQNMLAMQQVREAQIRYQYYLEQEKQEEKVRSIYHDMKNHLLVLENGKETETGRMAAKIRSEMADYENYVKSGNRILDVILKDKMQRAKERQIDLAVMVDFSEITFIEPLDISTIFGNAIDNALEACEKLPAEQRIITVKGGRKEQFALIMTENNYWEGRDGNRAGTERGHNISQSAARQRTVRQCTDKEDTFLHGFGIANIERAVRKYDGVCKIRKKDGRYTLTIIIPVPGDQLPNGQPS